MVYNFLRQILKLPQLRNHKVIFEEHLPSNINRAYGP